MLIVEAVTYTHLGQSHTAHTHRLERRLSGLFFLRSLHCDVSGGIKLRISPPRQAKWLSNQKRNGKGCVCDTGVMWKFNNTNEGVDTHDDCQPCRQPTTYSCMHDGNSQAIHATFSWIRASFVKIARCPYSLIGELKFSSWINKNPFVNRNHMGPRVQSLLSATTWIDTSSQRRRGPNSYFSFLPIYQKHCADARRTSRTKRMREQIKWTPIKRARWRIEWVSKCWTGSRTSSACANSLTHNTPIHTHTQTTDTSNITTKDRFSHYRTA